MDSVSIFIVIYLFFQLLLGYWLSKKIQTESDYFNAGRNLPLGMISISLFATWFGAETCIGTSAAVYSDGLSGGRADPFGYTICLILMGVFLAARLWKGNFITLSDFYRQRYGAWAEKLTVLIIVPSSLLWGAAQVRAFGQVISATTQMDVELGIALAACLVIAYTTFGGLLGDMYTDLIQGVFLAIGLITLAVLVLSRMDSPWETLTHLEHQRLNLMSSDETLLERMDRWMVPILGSLVAQELISRVFAARSQKIAVKACYISAAIYLFLGFIPVLLGLLGPTLIKDLAEPEHFLISLARAELSPLLFVVFAGALISAILSTIDSILLAISSLLTHNLLIPLFKIQNENQKLKWARLTVVSGGILAYVIALQSDSIYELVQASSSFGAAGILVITIMGLYSHYGNGASASSALIIGMFTMPVAEYIFAVQAPFMTAIAAALAAYMLAPIFQSQFLKFPPQPVESE